MLLDRLTVLAALAILPAAAQVSRSPVPTDITTESPSHRHAPIRVVEEHDDGTVTSDNWSGYALTGAAGSFTEAEGSWIVPAVTCSSGTQYAAFWVGIDGYTSKTVEQTGTDSDCSKGVPSYYAWYEFFPEPSFIVSGLQISPGDRIAATVRYDDPGFTITIKDETTGQSFSKSGRVPSAMRKSVEWVAEAPTSTTGIEPLADFGTVLFGGDSTGIAATCDATMDGQTGPIGSFPNIFQITMVSLTGATESVPSALSSDGSSFSAMWVSK
jgi:hypothetical protein